ESERYWRNRPRASQLSAWASRQSEFVESRRVLEERVAELAAQFGEEVPCPPFWGGYRLVPDAIGFWHHREDRLHDRLRYRRPGGHPRGRRGGTGRRGRPSSGRRRGCGCPA